jgi:hypothetical protein
VKERHALAVGGVDAQRKSRVPAVRTRHDRFHVRQNYVQHTCHGEHESSNFQKNRF